MRIVRSAIVLGVVQAVHEHAERRRTDPVSHACGGGSVGECSELPRPLQSYHGGKRHSFEIKRPYSNFPPQRFNFQRADPEIFTLLVIMTTVKRKG